MTSPGADETLLLVLECFKDNTPPASFADLQRKTALPSERLNAVLCLLESKGYIVRSESKYSRLNASPFKTVTLPEIAVRGIVHDLNNTLCVSRGNIAFAKMNISPDQADTLKILDLIDLGCSHAADVVRQMLHWMDKPPQKERISMGKLVENVVKLGISGSDIQGIVNIAPDEWPVECDEAGIFRVMVNIVLNARQAMAETGMLRVNVQNTILQAGAHSPLKEGRYVKTSISNTGSQISQENLKRLFQEGFTTKAGGKGVGLAVSAQIIKEHGGCIEARSEKDVGTTFDVYLPAVA